MTRLLLAAISAIFTVSILTATGSIACVSCNYTPEVVNTPVKGAAGANKKARAAKAKTRKAPAAQKRIAKPRPAVEKPAKSETASKPVPTDQAADGDASGVSTAALGDDERKPAEQQTKPSDSVGCKKFSPTAGTTIPVPCE